MMKSLSRLLTAAALCVACSSCSDSSDGPGPDQGSADSKFAKIGQDYVVYFLARNPVAATYLGGSTLDPSLDGVDGRLRDHSAAAIAEEDQKLTEFKAQIEALDRAALSPTHRIDRDVALAQIAFQLRLHQVRKYQERALDTYVGEPLRGLDWQLQGMTDTGNGKFGTDAEWQRVIERLEAIPAYLKVAEAQLRAGLASGNTPDWRMLSGNGVNGGPGDYFQKTLPELASERISGSRRDALLDAVRQRGAAADAAYAALQKFIVDTFFDDATKKDKTGLKPAFQADRYAFGEAEYNWAIQNNLRLSKNATQLYDEAWAVVEGTQREMVKVAREIGQKRGLTLPPDDMAAVRAVDVELGKEAPKSDDEMLSWYREAGERLVDYSRKTGLFDMPAEYKLEVVLVPPALQKLVTNAAYYPAPAFKDAGVGRFYVPPTFNDPAQLAENNRSTLAYLAAHEGFPGHDWHYKVMTQHRNEISRVRWLTPGAVEDSSSMWEDSAAAEGWGLYAEAIMAEPQPGAPDGFYEPEERLFQLRGKLMRDIRVRVDIGIHTNRMSFDEAVDLFSEALDFLPGPCVNPADPKKEASCATAKGQITRYSKWPTQAITYRLGKEQILELRGEAMQRLGARFSPKTFHLHFMKQGTISPVYFREQLLSVLEGK